jgi:hypothetical protein
VNRAADVNVEGINDTVLVFELCKPHAAIQDTDVHRRRRVRIQAGFRIRRNPGFCSAKRARRLEAAS